MNDERLQAFLQEVHLLDLVTITPAGLPHVTPVWYLWDGEHFLMSTMRFRKKARNLAKNPKAGFSIAPEELSYKAVVGHGTVEMESDADGELLRQLCYRYLPENKAEEYFESMLQDRVEERVKLTLTPAWMTSWEG